MDGLLIAALTDLEYKEEITVYTSNYTLYYINQTIVTKVIHFK